MKATMLAAVAAALIGLSPAYAAEEPVRVQIGGTAANGHLVTADGKTLAEGVVLMVHGTLAHGRMEIMQALQSGLAERGLNSLAVTLTLGMADRSGMYDCAKPHRHKHSDAVEEIAAWVGWLKQRGASKIVLLGHSRGGSQVAWYAAERGDPAVERVALVAPMRWDEKDEQAQYQARYGKDLSAMVTKARALAEQGKADQDLAADFLYCSGATATAGAVLSYYGPEPRRDTPTLLPAIKQPVLVIAAGDDQVVRGLPEAVKPLADGKKIQLKVVDGADHMFLDLAADEAADAIAAFVAGG